ncbi:MAG: sensor histidine kinase [Woeseiaceae bacterium]
MVTVMKGHAGDADDATPSVASALGRFFALSLDLHVVASPDGYFKLVSDSVTEVLGWSVDEFLNTPFIDFVHPDDHAATLAEVERQMQSGERVLHLENRYRHKDGSWRVLAWKSIPADGLMYATARDVTRFKQIQGDILQAQHAAEAANRELESFSYSVAHDLRAPLRSIDGFSQILLDECAQQLSADGKRFLGLVRESAQHMAKLIDDILELSRVARVELHCEAVDLSALARAAHARLRQSDPARRVDLTIPDGLTAHGDVRLLAVVLDNLLGNAWKYTSKRADARIVLGVIRKKGVSEYFVQDNGAGFDMAYVDKLFGVFERLHSADEFEGTGVGLATVRRIVERHGGRVRAEGREGAGATFYFTLPRGRSRT